MAKESDESKSIKSFITLAVMYYVEARNEFAEVHFRVIVPTGNTALSEEMLQDGESLVTLHDLISPRFEPQTFRSKDECVTARPSGYFIKTFLGLNRKKQTKIFIRAFFTLASFLRSGVLRLYEERPALHRFDLSRRTSRAGNTIISSRPHKLKIFRRRNWFSVKFSLKFTAEI